MPNAELAAAVGTTDRPGSAALLTKRACWLATAGAATDLLPVDEALALCRPFAARVRQFFDRWAAYGSSTRSRS